MGNKAAQQTLLLGHSPDPDDAFMFYGLARGLVDPGRWRFEHVLQDIQTLNERALRGELHHHRDQRQEGHRSAAEAQSLTWRNTVVGTE